MLYHNFIGRLLLYIMTDSMVGMTTNITLHRHKDNSLPQVEVLTFTDFTCVRIEADGAQVSIHLPAGTTITDLVRLLLDAPVHHSAF